MSYNIRTLDNADLRLIEFVRENPALYDPRYPDFRIPERKNIIWQMIAGELNMGLEDLRRRWTCLRDKYTRELRQSRFNSDRKDYFINQDILEQMNFLRIFVRKRRERRSKAQKRKHERSHKQERMLSAADDSDMEQNYEIMPQQKLSSPQSSSFEYNYVDMDSSQNFDEFDEATKSVSTPVPVTAEHEGKSIAAPQQLGKQQTIQIESGQPQSQIIVQEVNEDADEFFCKSVAVYLRQLSRRHKIKAKVEMYQILQKYIDIEEDLKDDIENM